MAQLVVRHLEDDVKERLQAHARKHGMSLEELVRDILRDAAKPERPTGGLGSKIAARFRGHGLDADIPEFRGFPVKLPSFDE